MRAGIVDKPEEHPWSSYRAFIGQADVSPWLQRDFILSYFGRKEIYAQQEYCNFVEDLLEQPYESPLKNVFGNILGTMDFVEEISALYLKEIAVDRDVPALRKLQKRPTPEQIISKVKATINNDEKRVRQVSIYLCHHYSGSKLRDLGKHFNIGESAISEASRRFGMKLEKDAACQAIIERLREQLTTPFPFVCTLFREIKLNNVLAFSDFCQKWDLD